MQSFHTIPEAEEDDMAEEADEDEDEYGEYGEEGEEAEYGEEGEDGEEEAEPTGKRQWPPPNYIQSGKEDDRVFRGNETLRSKFNEVEIENFMKILAIKPHVQW